MPTKKQSKETKKPVQEIRMGRIKAAVWANDTEKGVRYNVTLSPSHRRSGLDRNPYEPAAHAAESKK